MSAPAMPPRDEHFRTAVYGTVFGRRMDVVHRLHEGDRLILVPDPPGTDYPAVWVHAPGGDVIGHLPDDIARWLAPWMLEGGRCGALVSKVGTDDVESWRRLIIEVHCRTERPAR
ncbi:MAG TPA: HIRAN domain-containing protein [Gemmatimonadaceae bacterium]|nr:HIRAN domain-containing protein [Gemmatimonadaceae bacterium]